MFMVNLMNTSLNTKTNMKLCECYKLNELKEKYPNDRILEELVLPGTKTDNRKSTLKADFFIPVRSLIVEVHGQQHTEYNNFFFANKMDFYKAQARDRDKKQWCKINNLELIELFHNEPIEEWRDKIWKR